MKKQTYKEILKNFFINMLTNKEPWLNFWESVLDLWRSFIDFIFHLSVIITIILIFITSPISLPILAGVFYFGQDKRIKQAQERKDKFINSMAPNSKNSKPEN